MTPLALSPKAFVALLLLACMFAGNHVAARVAFDHGVDVVTAVAVRSLATALVVSLLVVWQRVPLAATPRHRRFMPLIALLVGVQSLCLYAAVARLPVGLALLVFNSYPIWATLAARVLYGRRPERAALVAMPVILFGLALALDVFGMLGGGAARAHWAGIGPGVGFALGAATSFGLVLALTQHEVADLDGRVRSAVVRYFTDSFQGQRFTEDEFLKEVERFVVPLARRGSAVFVGRGAAFLLRDEPVLRVLTVAPAKVRTARWADERGVAGPAAEESLRAEDEARFAFIRHHFHERLDDAGAYDLSVNVGTLGLEAATGCVIDAYRRRFPRPR